MRIRTRAGEYVRQEASLSNFFDDPEIGMMLIELQAPTQHQHVEQAIELSRIGADVRDILTIVLSS